MNIDFFHFKFCVEDNRLFVLVYINHANNVKRFNARKYYLRKGIIKNYNVIINGKKLMCPSNWLWYTTIWRI